MGFEILGAEKVLMTHRQAKTVVAAKATKAVAVAKVAVQTAASMLSSFLLPMRLCAGISIQTH